MNTIPATHSRRPSRPFLVRAAHAWYAWAGLAATTAGAYFAANGQLRVGEGAHLRAADPVSWKPSAPPPTSEGSKIILGPAMDPDDPFRAAPAPTKPTKVEPDIKPADVKPADVKPVETKTVTGPTLPDPFVAPDVKPALSPKAGAVLNAYMHDKAVVPTSGEEPAKLPKITPPPLVVPALPPSVTKSEPIAGPALPVSTNTSTLPAPSGVPPIVAPGGPSLLPPGTSGVKLPPIPPPPGQVVTTSGTPVSKPLEARLPNTLIAQEPEQLNVLPKAIEKPAEKKEPPPPKKRKILGTLSQDDEIKLNAAQTEARLLNFNRAIALMADVISRNPEEYDLRAEFAGILLSAGDHKRAIRELETVIKAAPNVAGYRLLLGDAYMNARKYKEAADVFMTALEMIGPDSRLAERIPEVVIRAARAYALDGDLFRAAFLVDRYLSGIRVDDPRAPLAMGGVLLDLDRPYDALPYLIEKRKQLLASPEASEEYELKVLEILASMVRGFARVGDRQQAMDAIKEMAPYGPKKLAIRDTLGDILFGLNEFELAGHVYNQVLAVDPANSEGLLGIADVYLETYQPTAAKRVLDSFIPNAVSQRHYLLSYSSYHQTVGEYTEAKQIYLDMLRRNDSDTEIRYALGQLYEYTNEWEKAKAEFAKIPPQDKMGRKARLWFGRTLNRQRKYAEAAAIAEQFMRDDPNNPEGVVMYVRATAKMGQFDRAIQAGRGYLATNPRDERNATLVRLAVGRAMLDANRALDAAREFEIVLSRPAGRIPEAYYGLSRAAEKLGNPDRAHQIIATLCGAVGGDVRNKLALADFYSQDFEDAKVIEILSTFPEYDGNNLAVLIRLADAQQRLSRWSGNPADAFNTASQAIRISPTNVRAHLAMARSFAIAQNYRKSAVQYDQLIAIDPTNTVPPRERARVLFSDHQYSAARSQYNVMLTPSPEEVVVNHMAYDVQRDGRFRQAFAPYLGGPMGGPALRSELARLAASSPDEEVRHAAHRMICDYDATLAWQETFRLERDAKELKGYRPYASVAQYQALFQFEPSNTEASYDLAQVFGDLKQTRAELTWYANTLAIDPTHRDSICFSERASAEISPKLDLSADWMSERGRSGLTAIDRTRLTGAVSIPYGDENEFVKFGYTRIALNPVDGPQVEGNLPFIRAQKKFDDNRLLAYAQIGVEQYAEGRGFNTRPVFDIGYTYDHNDVFHSRSGIFLENVAENGESIRQDIHRCGFYCGGDVRPTRTWAFGGQYMYSHYSDDNDAHQGYLFNEVSLTLPPKQLKIVEAFTAESYREQTRFPLPIPFPDHMAGTVHPYFAPDFYANGQLRIEWWHWLSRDTYVHSNQCWYSLQYGITTDTNLIVFHDFRAIFNYDINSCVSVGGMAEAYLGGDTYTQYQAMAFLQVRFLGK